MKLLLYGALTLLLGLGAALLYRAPVHRYGVACERSIALTCVLDRTTVDGEVRTRALLDSGAAAVVRVVPRRRGTSRVLLYLETPTRAFFAAEFEGADAAVAAARAAGQLNEVLRGTATVARVEAVPPRVLRWLSWGMLGLMGALIAAGVREARRTPSPRLAR